MPITPLPTPPTRADSTTFADRGDSFLSALPVFATEANELQVDVNAKQTAAAASQVAAAASQAAAEAASTATAWVSGTTYAVGNVRYSPINFLSYRRKTAGAGTTDPSADSTNWQLLNGLGNVDLNSTQTLTNKTFSTGSVWNGTAVPIANGGTGASTAANAFNALKQAATESATGVVELATTAEAAAGTDTSRVVTPAGLRAGLNASGSAPVYACRAWVNFKGTDTVAIRASGNVSSITDNGVGDYTVNFTTAMPDANYSVAAQSARSATPVTGTDHFVTMPSTSSVITSSVRLFSRVGGGAVDVDSFYATIFR
jgi:hypothetical protein